MLSATFDDRGGGANYSTFSVNLTRSRAIFSDPEILYIIRRTCCTSQGDPDSSFPCGHADNKSLIESTMVWAVWLERHQLAFAVANCVFNLRFTAALFDAAVTAGSCGGLLARPAI